MNVGQRIREVREDLGMQATVLARRAGVAPNTIYRIETGERTPSMALLEKIARELRTEPAELLREPVPLAEAPPSGPEEVVQADYPYPWMGDVLARTIDRWTEAVRKPSDPKYSNIIAVSCIEMLWPVLRHDVPGDSLKDRVPEEEEYKQRVRLAEKLFKLAERAQNHYVDSKEAEAPEVRSFEERREEIKRRTRELSA
jgi:transcriptional regulator with XRE-family HTH domain